MSQKKKNFAKKYEKCWNICHEILIGNEMNNLDIFLP